MEAHDDGDQLSERSYSVTLSKQGSRGTYAHRDCGLLIARYWKSVSRCENKSYLLRPFSEASGEYRTKWSMHAAVSKNAPRYWRHPFPLSYDIGHAHWAHLSQLPQQLNMPILCAAAARPLCAREFTAGQRLSNRDVGFRQWGGARRKLRARPGPRLLFKPSGHAQGARITGIP